MSIFQPVRQFSVVIHRICGNCVRSEALSKNHWKAPVVRGADADERSPFEKFRSRVNVPARFSPFNFSASKIMSQHRSLRGASTIAAKRNVLKRFERVELLKKRGQWKEKQKVIGLPKTKPEA